MIESSQPPTDEAPEDEFALGPYLDTLYRWCEAQPWYDAEVAEAWGQFSGPSRHLKGAAPLGATLPEATDPDAHDRLLRFWGYFALDRPLSGGERPIQRFIAAHGRDLTVEGRAVYEGLTQTILGAFKTHVKFRVATLEKQPSGERYQLEEGPLTHELQHGDLVVGRLYPSGVAYVADPDIHIGHLSEATASAGPLDAPTIEARHYSQMVPAKGAVMDVVDALLVQIDSPLTADDVFELIRESESLDALVAELYTQPAYKLRYLHLRDRSLLDELLQELWDTSGPLQDASLSPIDAMALARTVREGLKAIADGDTATLLGLADPKGFFPLYLDLFGAEGLKRLADVTDGAPGTSVRTKHQLLPKDGGIFTTLTWGKEGDRHTIGMVAYGTPEGHWMLSDVSPPEGARPQVLLAYDKAQHLGWATPAPPDAVEAHLRAAVTEVGYSVHDTIDLFRLWRDFKAAGAPDLSQPGIWAAGLELADSRYRNENLDVKVLAKSYGVMPRAIEAAADTIDKVLGEAE